MPVTERGDRFLLLFALANAGGVVAYLPLLTLLLPAKVAAVAGEARIEWLGAATLAGAVAASLANIVFGWASDVAGTRRLWASAGLCLTVASYVPLHLAASPAALVAAVAAFQVALNMLLAPLAAWASDSVPDRRKGLLGGIIGAGAPAGALAGVVATLPALGGEGLRLATVCALAIVLTGPILLLGSPPPPCPVASGLSRRPTGHDFALLMIARLLSQVAGNVMLGFLYYYFHGLGGAPSQADVARLAAMAVLLAFPIALVVGRLSDRLGPRKPFLVAAAVVAAFGLVLMAFQAKLAPAAVGYALFGCGNAVFLALQSSYAMQLLPSPARRGRDLGVLNLANTLPAIVAPLLAIWLVPGRGFGALLATTAGLMLLAAGCTLLVRRDAQAA